MISSLSSHRRYVRFALAYSRRHGGLRTDQRHYHVWQRLKKISLGLVYAPLVILYSETQGRLERDPLFILPSCLAVMLCTVTYVWFRPAQRT